MNEESVDRRRFLQGAAAAAGAALLDASQARGATEGKSLRASKPIRLGARVFHPPEDPEELAMAHRKLGYRAAYCPPVSLGDKDRVRDVSAGFAKHDVVIAEVGRWCNLLDPDLSRRAANLERVTEGLALAEEIGARCCVDIAGSYNPDVWYGPHPDNLSARLFDESVENARRIIDAVRPRRAKFCYEMMGWTLPDSADSYLKLLKAVDRESFAVHLDPCNLINSPARFYGNTQLLDECFDKLGPWIVSCHAKDVAWEVEMQVHFREVPLGAGSLDYVTYLKRLATSPGDPPLMIEHMKDEREYDRSRRHLLALAEREGMAFE